MERNDEKIVIIFLKNTFHIKFLPHSSILQVGIGSQVATFMYSLEQFLEVSYHFFSKSKGYILDDFGVFLHKMLKDIV